MESDARSGTDTLLYFFYPLYKINSFHLYWKYPEKGCVYIGWCAGSLELGWNSQTKRSRWERKNTIPEQRDTVPPTQDLPNLDFDRNSICHFCVSSRTYLRHLSLICKIRTISVNFEISSNVPTGLWFAVCALAVSTCHLHFSSAPGAMGNIASVLHQATVSRGWLLLPPAVIVIPVASRIL